MMAWECRCGESNRSGRRWASSASVDDGDLIRTLWRHRASVDDSWIAIRFVNVHVFESHLPCSLRTTPSFPQELLKTLR